MTTTFNQRQGVLSQLRFSEEGASTFGLDTGITTQYVLNLSAEPGFVGDQPQIEVPSYTGDRTMNQSVWGMIGARGPVPQNLDFLTFLRQLVVFFGRGNYSRPGAGTTALHRCTNTVGSTTGPGSCQLEAAFLDGTPQYIRHRGVRADAFHFKQNLSGAVTYSLDYMGIGDIQLTSVGGTVTTDPFQAASYFNGIAFINASGATPVQIGGMTDFGLDIANRLSRQDVSFNGGVAGAINADKMQGKGQLGILFATDGTGPELNLTFYNYGKNQNDVLLDCFWFNGPLTSWTSYVRVRVWVRFQAKHPVPGGATGRTTNQSFDVCNSIRAVFPGEIMAPAPGPYTLPASAHLGVKVNGGSTIDVVLGITGSQTAAAIATALNADSTFAAAATAYDRANALYIVSDATPIAGALTSIQIDGTVSGTAHTAIGFHTVAQSGRIGTPVMVDTLNTTGADV